jgi:ABC-2 type transport system permease protein
MRAIIALAVKDLKILFRDKFGLFWVAAFPLLMALFFGSIFGSGGSGAQGLKIAFVGTGDTAAVYAFRDALSSSDVLTVEEMTLDSARNLVGLGKRVAYVHYIDTVQGGLGFFGPGKPAIEIGIDPARKAESGYLSGLINQAYFGLLADQMMNPAVAQPAIKEQIAVLDTVSNMAAEQKRLLTNMLSSLDNVMGTIDQLGGGDTGAAAANSPFAQPDISVEEITVSSRAPASSWEITFPQSLQWALIGVAAAFAIGLVVERRNGTFLRLRLAPISRFQILAGKGFACFTAAITSSAVLLAIGILIFGVRVASWPMLAIAVGSSAFCFVGIMMFMSVLGKTEQAVAGAGWAILLVMSMTGGGMVPLMMMPSWMFKLGSFSAVKWSILAIEGAIWRGFGPSEMVLPVGVLLGMGVLGLTVGTIILSKSD